MRCALRVLIPGLMLLALGCGGGPPAKPKTYAVSGKVTVGGKAPADCVVQFVSPDKGTSFSGTIGGDGSYTLTDVADPQRTGAEPGKYKVVLQQSPEAMKKAMMSGAMKMPGAPVAEAPFPSEYLAPGTSPKEVEVKAETNTIDIAI